MLRKPPKTYLGFPVGEQQKLKSKRGIAMIMAILVSTTLILFTSDLIINSAINSELGLGARNGVKAEYMARSAFNAAKLLISADFAFDLFNLQQNPKGKLTDGLSDWWGALNGLPIGGETAEMLSSFGEQFNIGRVTGQDTLEQLALFDGSFVLNVTDETNKINVNFCTYGRCSEILLMLEALFSCPAEKAFLESKDIDPKELAFRIKDYVDTNSKAEAESGFNDEDDPYFDREPREKAKNAPFDTLDELKKIPGWDEEMHAVFAPYLTIFPYQENGSDKSKINVNTTSRELLQCLVPESQGDCSERTAIGLAARNKDRSNVADGSVPMGQVLKDLLCYNQGDIKQGDPEDRSAWFAQSSDTFRIEAEGYVGEQVKKLTVIVQRIMPDPKKDEISTYKILYWKMI